MISLSAKGLTTGEVAAHLAEVYGAQVSRQTISTITDKVVEGMAEWQNRPLDPVYPVIFIDAINVKIRDGKVANRPIYVALAVTADGHRDILGLWAGDGGEGAKYWLHVLTEIKNRGVNDVLMIVCDGLTELPDAGTSTSSDRYRRTVRRLISRCRAIALTVQPRACSALASTTGSHASIISGLPRLVTIRSDHRVGGAPRRRWDLPPATHQLGTFSEQV